MHLRSSRDRAYSEATKRTHSIGTAGTRCLLNVLALSLLSLPNTISLHLSQRLLPRAFMSMSVTSSSSSGGGRVAVIGFGAAGLVTAKVLREHGLHVTVFERGTRPGGVWQYVPNTGDTGILPPTLPPTPPPTTLPTLPPTNLPTTLPTTLPPTPLNPPNPMYRTLRTNLPREVMAFGPDDPFPPPTTTAPGSYLTHWEVQQYLETYAHKHTLHPLVRYGTEVRRVYRQAAQEAQGQGERQGQAGQIGETSGSSSSGSGSGGSGGMFGDGKWVVEYAPSTPTPSPPPTSTSTSTSTPPASTPTSVSASAHATPSTSTPPSPPPLGTALFDFVVVCNGHYSLPHLPQHVGTSMSLFPGPQYHSSQYDGVKGTLGGKNVLVVGSKSSGTDMARELKQIANKVYVSDRNYVPTQQTQGQEQQQEQGQGLGLWEQHGNLYLLPGLAGYTEGTEGAGVEGAGVEGAGAEGAEGGVRFINGAAVRDIDAVLWCTGFEYDFPFLQGPGTGVGVGLGGGGVGGEGTGVGGLELGGVGSTAAAAAAAAAAQAHPLSVVEGETTVGDTIVEEGKRVRPLYLQLLSLHHPSLSFVGLPFSVVPFPLFSLQAQYLAALYSGSVRLPPVSERLAWLMNFEEALAHKGLIQEKYHFLGGAQWDYCRMLGKEAGVLGAEGNGAVVEGTGATEGAERVKGKGAGVEGAGAGLKGTGIETGAGEGVWAEAATEQTGAAERTATVTEKQRRLGRYLDLLESIYDDNGLHKPAYTGASDTYRDRRYNIDWDTFTWTVDDV